MIEEIVTSWVKQASVTIGPSGLIIVRGELGGHIRITGPDNPSAMQIALDAAFLNGIRNHPDHHAAVLSNATVDVSESMLSPKWRAEFETRTPELGGQSPNRPEGLPPQWNFEIGTETTVESRQNNIFGEPLITVTSEPYDPPLQDDFQDTTFIFSTEQIPVNWGYFTFYRNTVNDRPFMGYPAGCCKMGDMRARVQFIPGQEPRMSATVAVHVRDPADVPTDTPLTHAWSQRVIAQGYKIKDATSGQIRRARILDASGNEMPDLAENYVDTPVLHNSFTGERINDPTQTMFYLWTFKRPENFDIFFNDLLG